MTNACPQTLPLQTRGPDSCFSKGDIGGFVYFKYFISEHTQGGPLVFPCHRMGVVVLIINSLFFNGFTIYSYMVNTMQFIYPRKLEGVHIFMNFNYFLL